ncbi:membrane protein insertase YidC [Buchnera aphidicola]|uniref:Membrane protein insertase YidC n=1 Tax=Buchnera aphidicola subsp. Tuberolachnus salignus TaxID=98804 RepID=A0A170PBF5_BUCTT|nr:membrane protein insertase YidC [Buchnera aphidicola]CUR52999.1 Membrane protein insertase YidC [Buchnera aphidicola (Tuberolachnus salignus)]
MDFKRNFIIFVFLILSFFLFKVWKRENILSQNSTMHTHVSQKKFFKNYSNSTKKMINLSTDVLSLNVNLFGGDIEGADLLKYKKNLKEIKPFTLLKCTKNFFYKIVSGLSGKEGIDFLKLKKRPMYQTTSGLFRLKKNENILKVPLFWKLKSGIIYVKTFILKKGCYDFDIEYTIYNPLNKKLNVTLFSEIQQTSIFPKFFKNTWKDFFSLKTYKGAAYSCDKKNYTKYSFDEIKKNRKFFFSTKSGWISMLQQYFSVASILKHSKKNFIYSYFLKNNTSVLGTISKNKIVLPHSIQKFSSKIWIGPSIYKYLSNVAKHLNLIIDYGWFWFLSQFFLKILLFFYSFINSWGITIILITVCLRSIMFPLIKWQYSSVNKMKKIQPKISQIKKNFFNDSLKMNQEILKLYQKEEINPFSSFIPILIQMPIFLALYHVLIEAIELRHASFLFWIQDLSAQDPYYILPILMGISMIVMNFNIPKMETDDLSQKMIYFVPLIFTIFFSCFPSGLVLYYLVSNVVTIIQQKMIYFLLKKNT